MLSASTRVDTKVSADIDDVHTYRQGSSSNIDDINTYRYESCASIDPPICVLTWVLSRV